MRYHFEEDVLGFCFISVATLYDNFGQICSRLKKAPFSTAIEDFDFIVPTQNTRLDQTHQATRKFDIHIDLITNTGLQN